MSTKELSGRAAGEAVGAAPEAPTAFVGCSFLDQELAAIDWSAQDEIAKRALASDADTARRRAEIDAERASYRQAHDAARAQDRDDETRGYAWYRHWYMKQIAFDLWVTECDDCRCSHSAPTAQRLREKLEREHPAADPDPDESYERERDLRAVRGE